MLTPEQRAALEDEMRQLAAAGNLGAVAARVIEGYGPEIYGYLVATARSETDAADAFSMFTEDLWCGVAEFRWGATMRTWAYTLARNALWRVLRATGRDLMVPLSQAPEVLELADRVRTRTAEYLRSEVKDRFAELRRELDPDDQTLLVLRVSREMTWNEIAQVLGHDHAAGDEALRREAARLRKRFERVKDKLAELARTRGICA